MTYRSAEERKKADIAAMGEALGSQYSELWDEVVYLHRKWAQYHTLLGTKPSRVELMNKAAPSFFRLVQDVLWEETLLHIARLTDPSDSGKGKNNLTIRNFPKLVTDDKLQSTIQALIDQILVHSEFCRDWRNRRIAHRDLALALDEPVDALKSGSRKQVQDLLKMIAEVMDTVSIHYSDSGTAFEFDANNGGAMPLLRILNDGVKAEAARRDRLKKRQPLDDDFEDGDL